MRKRIAITAGLAAAAFLAWPSDRGDALHGLWARPDLGANDVRFYYFHPDGHGLYRYGHVGLNKTASFDYVVHGDTLELDFRKSGAEHAVRFTLEGDALTLLDDPYEPTPTKYVKKRGPMAAPSEHPFARMWTHVERFATGGYAFAIYQLQAPDADGRGQGWFHEGDYDDWSTEALLYRVEGDRVTFEFATRGERASTPIVRHDDAPRAFTLVRDPRNFGQRRRYEDGGRSFGDALLLLPTPNASH